jgi:acyl carrier protein
VGQAGSGFIQQVRHNHDCREFEESGMMNKLANGVELRNGALTPEELELARLIASALNLENQAEEIDPAASLYGEGLGLDSIDILEIALAISKAYGIRLRSDDSNNQKIFSSLRSLNQHIQQFRAK